MNLPTLLSPKTKKLFFLFLLAFALALGTWSYISAIEPTHWGGQTSLASSDAASLAGPLSGVPCTAGFAGPYPCKDVDLLAYLPLNALAVGTAADIWGWIDPQTGVEYSILGHSSATSFVDLSDPTLPVVLGELPAPVPNVLWRDIKVYRDHAYIIGDGDFVLPHGLQIFDLTQLRGAGPAPAVFSQTARYTNFGHAHNLAINEETGFAYVVGSNTCAGGLHMIDLANPTSPAFAGCFSEDGYVHDTQCVVYRGPDLEYQSREICFASNEDTLTIVDVTDKSAPVMLSRTTYQGVGYTHQGWLTGDHAYFILGDELDEMNDLHNTYSYLWNVSDLDAPVHFSTYIGPTTSIDHNLFIRGDFVYESNYTSGLRILDASDVASGNLSEVAFFDTHPSDDAPVFAGTWSNYPFFQSGIVILSNIEDGLFVVQPHLPLTQAQATGGGWLQGVSGKINFGFDIALGPGRSLEGELQLNDKAAGAKINLTGLTSFQEGDAFCSAFVQGERVAEFTGDGAYNGAPASFRVCAADSGEPGRGVDQFYLACTAGCDYNTANVAADSTLDGGNLQVDLGSDGGEASAPQATTLILDPLLLGDGLLGQLQVFTVTVYDQNQSPLTGAPVTLARTAADGSVESLSGVTGILGQAVFSLVNLGQSAEYLATSGSAESNTIELSPLLE